MRDSEAAITSALQMAASAAGHRLHRNHSGAVKIGNRWQKFQLGGKGSPDLIGWTRRGFFVAVEVKSDKGRTTSEQKRWLNAVPGGAVAEVCQGMADVERVLRVMDAADAD